ncbi:MBL fold metallo-hydrolase [Arenibaculum pallidiluteum]|uniref:MBL fold metallo-hydrolase n=1 Tax=Arenibaculum pallidiluteum TaxID=2812559 RepID=UPI001F1B6140|nr:MBL fold metallo-hydrolase [Arenibaculum pallidiluteum]
MADPGRRSVLRLLGLGAAMPVAGCAAGPAGTASAVSDHFDGTRFRNLYAPADKGFGDLLRWRLTSQPVPWPERVENAAYAVPNRVSRGQVAVTFVGHASFLVQVGGVAILTDPVWSERASPFSFVGPLRVRDPGQPLAALPGVELLLVSHNHYDHLDLATLREVQARWAPPTVTGLGNAPLLAEAGIAATELDWWQSVEVAGTRITYVPAQHFSARGLFDRNRALWGGFVVEADGATVYFAGDSGYCPHFAEIGQRFPRIDLALLPIGAYEPRWFMTAAHMNPDEAVQAHLDLGGPTSIGMHFGTFRGLTDEAIDAPVHDLAAARAARGVAEASFGVLDFGETRIVKG